MLGNEDWMPAHRSLAAVVRRLRRREALGDEVAGVVEHRREAPIGEIGALLRAEAEAAPELGPGKPREDQVEIAHCVEGGTLDALCQRR